MRYSVELKLMSIKIKGILMLMVFYMHANAQKTDSLSCVNAIATSGYKAKFTFFPFIAYSPDTRLMYGAFLLNQFKPSGTGEETRPSNIQLSITHTLNKQIAISSHFTLLLPGKRRVWTGDVVYRKFPKSYWGIGPNTLNEDELKVDFQEIALKQGILRQIREDIYLGPLIHFSQMDNVKFKDSEGLPIAQPKVPGSEGSRIFGLGLILNWDKRDNVLTPTKNHLLELSALFYTPYFQNTYRFQRFRIDVRKYFNTSRSGKEVLAFQSLMVFTSGDVPFEELGMIGGEMMMRGYMEGRFRDKTSIQVQMEYRRVISDRFGAVIFGAIGEVMPRLSDLDLDNIKWTIGAGLRYNINKTDPTYIRFDYGFGKNTSGFYVTFGEAF